MIGCSAPYREAVEARFETKRDTDAEMQEREITLIQCDSHERWQQFETMAAADGDSVLIAVLPSLVLDDYVRALAAGASGVVYVDTPSAVTVDVIVAAVHGEVVLPRQAAQSLAVLAKRRQPEANLDPEEAELLRAVASGRTVVDLARETYFSERTVRRHLQSLYLKLGVRNRAEAIAAATRMGLLD